MLALTNTTDGKAELREYSAAFGTWKVDSDSPPVTTDTVMWIASCTKLVTTISALQCVERGLFSLDDPNDVERLLPEWNNPNILTGFEKDGQATLQPAQEKITLRRLLSHTSGLGYDFDPILFRWRHSRGESWLTMKVPVVEAMQTPLLFEPGTSWHYGGGVDLAGLMVARANQCTLEEYMRKHIFDVLGMDNTSFYAGHNDMVKRLMPLASRIKPDMPITDGTVPEAPLPDLVNPSGEYGGTGLCSTTEDYMKLLKSLLRDDGQLLTPESVGLIHEPALSPASKTKYNEFMAEQAKAGILVNGQKKGTSNEEVWTCSVAGRIYLEDSEEGLKAGWLSWGGAPNLKWWIDREGGTCGFFGTQLYPPGEPKHGYLYNMFQRAMVAQFSKGGE